MSKSIWTAPVLVVLSAGISSCSTTADYGTIKDYVDYGENTIKVQLPDNAPSIRRGFHPQTADKERRAPPVEHLGIDIIAAVGTPVLAPATGVVQSSFFEPMYGHHIVIAHGEDKNGFEIHTRFLHLQHRWVQAGENVQRGQQIGTLGLSGFFSGAIAHLHCELARYDPQSGRIKATDPNQYWVDGIGVITCFDNARQWQDKPFATTYPVVCKKQAHQ